MTRKEEEKNLTKEFSFDNFEQAVSFVNNVLPLAEEAQHHPDILIHGYNKVKVMLYTHDQDAITDKDHQLAKQIDAIE